ncbi:MAG: hypothetical protein ACFFB2_04030 [Promethearchaeota archaeon]
MSRFIKILYALTGAAAAIGIVSAIGSTCVSLDPYWQKATFAIAGEYSEVWFVTYFVTWFAAIVWGILFWALRARKSWFYPLAIINSILGFIGRGVPAILMSIGFFSKPRTGLLFTPSWASALLNLAILIILLIPAFKQQVKNHLESVGTSSGGSVGSQVSEFASVLFGFGIVMLLQPLIMPTHIIDGVNIASSYGYLLASGLLQFYGGLSCLVLGILTRIAGRLLTIYSSKPLPLEA